MTATHQEKLGAYASHQRGNENPRETDKRALLTCASKLKAVLDDKGADKKAYVAALKTNQQLWTIFQVAMTDPDNALPVDLKVTLMNLSRYVDRLSFRAVTEFSPHLITSLIDINRTIAAGLSARPAEAAAPAYQPVPAAAGYSGMPPAPPVMPEAGSVMISA